MKDSVRHYIKKIKDSNDQIYDPKYHQGWTEVILKDERDNRITHTICKYEMEDGQIIYTASDEDGRGVHPPNAPQKTTLIVHPLSEKIKYFKMVVSKGIKKVYKEVHQVLSDRDALMFLIGIFLTLIAPFLLIAALEYPKKKRKKERQEKRLNISNTFNKVQDDVRQELGTIYVYTNDTQAIQLNLQPNFGRYLRGSYYNSQDMEWFLERKEERGFEVLLQNYRRLFRQMKILDDSSIDLNHPDFRLTTEFEYTAEEYEKRQAHKLELEEEKKHLYSRNLGVYDNKYGGHNYILNQKDIANRKIAYSSNLQKLLAGPEKLFLEDPSFKFYFTPYRSGLSKEQFEQAVCDFQEMFMADPADRSCCKIRALTVQ